MTIRCEPLTELPIQYHKMQIFVCPFQRAILQAKQVQYLYKQICRHRFTTADVTHHCLYVPTFSWYAKTQFWCGSHLLPDVHRARLGLCANQTPKRRRNHTNLPIRVAWKIISPFFDNISNVIDKLNICKAKHDTFAIRLTFVCGSCTNYRRLGHITRRDCRVVAPQETPVTNNPSGRDQQKTTKWAVSKKIGDVMCLY